MTVKKEMAVKLLQMKGGQGAGYQHPDGAFLVRPSDANADDLSLTVKYIVFIVTSNIKHTLHSGKNIHFCFLA